MSPAARMATTSWSFLLFPVAKWMAVGVGDIIDREQCNLKRCVVFVCICLMVDINSDDAVWC